MASNTYTLLITDLYHLVPGNFRAGLFYETPHAFYNYMLPNKVGLPTLWNTIDKLFTAVYYEGNMQLEYIMWFKFTYKAQHDYRADCEILQENGYSREYRIFTIFDEEPKDFANIGQDLEWNPGPEITTKLDKIFGGMMKFYSRTESSRFGFGLDPDQHLYTDEEPSRLEDYGQVGIHISNIEAVAQGSCKCCHVSNVGSIPIILVDLRSRSAVRKAAWFTFKLRRQYNGVMLRCNPPLPENWRGSEASLKTFQDEVAALEKSQEKKHRIFRLGRGMDGSDDPGNEEPRTGAKSETELPPNLHNQIISPLPEFTAIFQFDYLPVKSRNNYDRVAVVTNQGKDTVVTGKKGQYTLSSIWKAPKKTNPVVFPTDALPLREPYHSMHYLRHCDGLPHILNFPELSVLKETSRPYLAGIGDNDSGESLADLVNHPLKDVLSYLPQCLAIGGALDHSRGIQEELTPDEISKIFRHVDHLADGTVNPWAYLGTPLTIFSLHTEDSSMPSANIHLAGAPKVWVFITEEGMKRLKEVLGRDVKACFTLHRTVFFHPRFLIDNGIPFNIAVQKPGDLIIADCLGAHQGWNTGNNCAFAANFVDSRSIPDIINRIFHPHKKNRGLWPCICREETCQVKGKPISSKWFDFNDVSKYVFEESMMVHATTMSWINAVRPYLDIKASLLANKDESREDPFDLDRFRSIWRHAMDRKNTASED